MIINVSYFQNHVICVNVWYVHV